MEGQLAAVPETESMELDHSTAAYPPPESMELDRSAAAYPPPESMELDHSSFYRDSIRNVAAVYQGPMSSALGPISSALDISSYSTGASSYSGASYASNYSDCPGTVCSFRALRVKELKDLALRMIRDGYIKGLVRELKAAGPEHPMKRWFDVLDVDWVLQIRGHDGLPELLQDNSLQELVERWTRALTVIIYSMTELELALASFGKASIDKMEVFVDAIFSKGHAPAEKLQAMLSIYMCVKNTYEFTETNICVQNTQVVHLWLSREQSRLVEGICSTMKEIRTLMEEDSSWAIDIKLGGGEVHRNTRFALDCIAFLRNAQRSMKLDLDLNLACLSSDMLYFSDQIESTINCLKDLLGKKSELCSDPSLRCLFLLNNFYFVAQKLEAEEQPFDDLWRLLGADCERHIESYFDSSWAHVLSCLSNPGPSSARNKACKFGSAFYRTYQAHKFWKIPDPKVRDKVRKTITERVISGYRKYMEDHPELQKYLVRGSSTPDALEKMLGELFEG